MRRDIRDAFPEMSEAQVDATVRDCYRWLVESLFDAAKFSRVATGADAAEMVETEGFEVLRMPGRKVGVIFVTGHVGAWELSGLASAAIGYPVISLARPRSNPFIERQIARLRESTGQKMLGKKGAMRPAICALRTGQNLAALVDQDARSHGVFVDFFGRPASTISTVARLSIMTGAPVAFAYGRRIPGQNRFCIHLSELILPDRQAPLQQEILRITRCFTRALEDVVREHPAEWLWLHRRWKTSPGKPAPPGRATLPAADAQPDAESSCGPAAGGGSPATRGMRPAN